MLCLPWVHRQQPARVGEVAEQLRRALGGEAQQTFAQGDVQAVTSNARALNGKPAQRETGGKIRQIASRFGFVEWLVRLRCRVKCVADQQRLFCFSKRQRFITQRGPAVAQVDRLPGMRMTFQHALLKTRQRIGIKNAFD